jgi:polyketide biosynthesis enoyl-CoA hydratase PksI
MSKETISLTRGDDGIAVLHMCDIEGSNALSESFVHLFTEKLAVVADDALAKVLLLRGTDAIFCSGGDKSMLTALASGDIAATDIMVSRALLEVPIPTIAAMEGHAVGGGLTLGLCCDMLLMARESNYGCSFMNMGFTPGMGTTRLLQLAVGDYVAAEMMYGGRYFRGSHFEGLSQANYVLPKSKLWPRAMKLARRIAEKPRKSLELLKRSLSISKRQAFEEARTSESFMHEISFAQEETLKLIEDNYQEPR